MVRKFKPFLWLMLISIVAGDRPIDRLRRLFGRTIRSPSSFMDNEQSLIQNKNKSGCNYSNFNLSIRGRNHEDCHLLVAILQSEETKHIAGTKQTYQSVDGKPKLESKVEAKAVICPGALDVQYKALSSDLTGMKLINIWFGDDIPCDELSARLTYALKSVSRIRPNLQWTRTSLSTYLADGRKWGDRSFIVTKNSILPFRSEVSTVTSNVAIAPAHDYRPLCWIYIQLNLLSILTTSDKLFVSNLTPSSESFRWRSEASVLFCHELIDNTKTWNTYRHGPATGGLAYEYRFVSLGLKKYELLDQIYVDHRDFSAIQADLNSGQLDNAPDMFFWRICHTLVVARQSEGRYFSAPMKESEMRTFFKYITVKRPNNIADTVWDYADLIIPEHEVQPNKLRADKSNTEGALITMTKHF